MTVVIIAQREECRGRKRDGNGGCQPDSPETIGRAMALHRTIEELNAALADVLASPRDAGRLELIVRRPAVDLREELSSGTLDVEEGLIGDYWGWTPGADDPEGRLHQVTLMNVRVAGIVAVDPQRRALAGDQLYVDFDLSEELCPAGTLLRIGGATLELTAPPHTGCSKFRGRFGLDALKWVNSAGGRALRLRGANARVVTSGEVRVGDVVERIERDRTAAEPSAA